MIIRSANGGVMTVNPRKKGGATSGIWLNSRLAQIYDPNDIYDMTYMRALTALANDLEKSIMPLASLKSPKFEFYRLYPLKDEYCEGPFYTAAIGIEMKDEGDAELLHEFEDAISEKYSVEAEIVKDKLYISPEYAWEDPEVYFRIRDILNIDDGIIIPEGGWQNC